MKKILFRGWIVKNDFIEAESYKFIDSENDENKEFSFDSKNNACETNPAKWKFEFETWS